ncbi:MAG: hypothetical protein K2F79_08015, partial [Muribaculaceae bacterium]|nr:hypothetical protein [Muribaculaceae bacterium]
LVGSEMGRRDRDTEGRLSLAAGIGYRLGSIILAVGADVMKYRQSNSIMFVSELGEIKIYQAGGLGTHYVRFAGSSKSADFSGLNRAVSLSMATDRDSGPFASLRYGRFTLSKDLADMNNLRLNHIGENSCNAQAGWRSPRLAASVALSASRRIGSDNIFGEAIGSVYPLIATYATFRRNTFSSGGMISARPLAGSRSHIDLSAGAFYNYTADRCLDPAQPRMAMIRNVDMALSAAWTAMAGRRIVLCAGASAAWRMPLSSQMEGIQGDFFLDRLAVDDFAFASRHRVDATLSASADYIMPRFCALGLRASYTRLWHAMANNGNAFEAAVCVKF